VKKLLLLALCALLAAGSAEARTLYVNAKRPNNKGNGLRPKTAKKTIQAAINIAKAGDTILVYPGTYAPIASNDRKIAIRSVKGASKTAIAANKDSCVVADLVDRSKGTAGSTKLAGFLLDGKKKEYLTACFGGTWKSCTFQHFTANMLGAKFTACRFRNNYLYNEKGGFWLASCTAARCKFWDNTCLGFSECKLNACAIYQNENFFSVGGRMVNCLAADNLFPGRTFEKTTFLNCTFTENSRSGRNVDPKARIFENCSFVNCILYRNFAVTWTDNYLDRTASLHNVDAGNTYRRTNRKNRNPQFVNPSTAVEVPKRDYRLRKGSYAIDQGRLTAARKKLVGKLDLGGRKRVRGKAIDLGCYEY
jgi:hypothetical protein